MRGELYEVDETRSALLDRLEWIGKPGNLRVVIEVEADPLEGAVSPRARKHV